MALESPSDILAQIREPLYSTKRFGTGFGLPAAERVLEQHGGGLEVENSRDAGACFTFGFRSRQPWMRWPSGQAVTHSGRR